MIQFFHYNKCGTCRKAKKYLDTHNIDYQEIDITLKPPSKAILKKAIKERGMKKLFNTSGVEYKERKIKDRIGSMTESEVLRLLASSGRLIKRPITVDDDRITGGFDEGEFKQVWKK